MDDCPETTEESGSGANAANICLVSVIHQGSAMLGSVPFISWVLVLCSVTWCLKDPLSHPCFPDLCAIIWFSSLHLAQRAAQRHAPIPSWWEKINAQEQSMCLCACCGPLTLVLPVPFRSPDHQVSLKVSCHTSFGLQMSH